MTQEEMLLARLKKLEPSSIYEIVVYVTHDKSIGFWFVEKKNVRLEGEQKRDIIPSNNLTVSQPV